jgi:hypothetical protein
MSEKFFGNPIESGFDVPPEDVDLHDELQEALSGALHNDTLYNQPPADGEVFDPTTGKRIENDTIPLTDDVVDLEMPVPLDLKKDVAGDPATDWLKANDPDLID